VAGGLSAAKSGDAAKTKPSEVMHLLIDSHLSPDETWRHDQQHCPGGPGKASPLTKDSFLCRVVYAGTPVFVKRYVSLPG
ncbi:MAG: hypothetical protein ACXVZZ_07305, partial [Terriglobales bacterium]